MPQVATEDVGCCLVCGATKGALFARGRDYELGTCANEWTVLSCADCAHAWLDPRPAASALPIIYPAHYYSYNMAQTVGSAVMRIKGRLDRRKLGKALAPLGRVARSYLDVGCGDGHYLSVMEALGTRRSGLYGLELNEAAASAARSKGFNIFVGNADSFEGFGATQFDVISMFHVIEHLADPRTLLRRLHGWLAPDGVLLIETPNMDSFDARLFRRSYWGGYHFPRHWHFFRPESLERLLAATGFRTVSVQFQTGHSFWLYSLHHALKYNGSLKMPWLARRFDPLRSKVALSIATALDLTRAWLGQRTSSMLVVAQRAS